MTVIVSIAGGADDTLVAQTGNAAESNSASSEGEAVTKVTDEEQVLVMPRQRVSTGTPPLNTYGATFSLRAKSRLRRLRSDTRLRAAPGEGEAQTRVPRDCSFQCISGNADAARLVADVGHQSHVAGTLDGNRQLTLMESAGTGNTAGE